MNAFPRSPLTIEALETRDVPTATAMVVGNRLDIRGDAQANRVEIYDDGRGNVTAKITTGQTVVAAAGKNIRHIDIETFGGDDVVDYRLTANLLYSQQLDVDTHDGNDNVRFDLYRGVSGVPLDIDVDTGAGRDAAEVRFGIIRNADIKVKAALGTDADAMTAIMFSGASGTSRVAFDVTGGSGADRVDFNMMGKIESGATVNVRASNTVDADDRFMVRYKGELDGKLDVVVDKAAASYGVQSQFTLDAASDGLISFKLTDARRTFHSTAEVTDHTGAAKITVLDRLVRHLTEPAGVKVTRLK